MKEVRRMRGRKKKKKRKGEEREGWIKRSWWRVWGGKGCKQRIKRGTDCEEGRDGGGWVTVCSSSVSWRKRTVEGNDDRYASLRTLRAEQPTTSYPPLCLFLSSLPVFLFFSISLSSSLFFSSLPPSIFPRAFARETYIQGESKKCNWNATSLDR